MPLFYFVLFLLFFAVLAAGYFYLQRAKARDAAVATDAAPMTDAPADASPVAEAAAADEGTTAPTA
jgi:hypothetical protein